MGQVGRTSGEEQLGLGQVLWELHSDQTQYFFQGVFAIEFASSNPERGYAGFGFTNCAVNFGERFCSSDAYISFLVTNDGGASWAEIASSISGFTVVDVAIDPDNQDSIWIASPGHGVYYSNDEGFAWERRSNGMGTSFVSDIELGPGNSLRL